MEKIELHSIKFGLNSIFPMPLRQIKVEMQSLTEEELEFLSLLGINESSKLYEEKKYLLEIYHSIPLQVILPNNKEERILAEEYAKDLGGKRERC